jgi:hypothetical protein
MLGSPTSVRDFGGKPLSPNSMLGRVLDGHTVVTKTSYSLETELLSSVLRLGNRRLNC